MTICAWRTISELTGSACDVHQVLFRHFRVASDISNLRNLTRTFTEAESIRLEYEVEPPKIWHLFTHDELEQGNKA
ncbi:Protein of unknown function [Pyronema omphalodes CBS 100304]|uniref:Uncharacterized protein n=1 Tax=Pyronema omphalodes (strain CBS 100304) TaxID=1076935 RepID=U4LUK8_PYROM|nr:Protein of unknown function [Pyronema omphalodes CBS 100304]